MDTRNLAEFAGYLAALQLICGVWWKGVSALQRTTKHFQTVLPALRQCS